MQCLLVLYILFIIMNSNSELNYPLEFYTALNDMPSKNVITRFPPEPNGFLHLGHVKAMEVDFGFAIETNGECILRFDDTNPVAETLNYYDSIREDVEWLGYNYSMETNTSNYFGLLYDFAILLIRRGDAYVCELSPKDISSYRDKKMDSPYKCRPIAESLRLFREMAFGTHPEGSMTLRMNGNLNNGNTTLWDVIMYRIINTPHVNTGNDWKIYPSYDYSHCIIDSIEGVTHSFCTKEYEIRRAQYYWFLDKLNLRKPYVYEFARLDIIGDTLSKRKIKEMVENGSVFGWDDPRLLTIKGLKRRGYVPNALRDFCKSLGITKCESKLESRALMESILRDKLNVIAPRRLVVINPIKLIITNYQTGIEMITHAKDFPADLQSNTRILELTREIFIDSKDFKQIDEKSFYGLAPGKIVLLKYGVHVEFEQFTKVDGESIIYVKIVDKPSHKIKGILNWVGSNYIPITIRSFDKMTMTEMLCYAEPSLKLSNVKLYDKFQFEKYGYYCVDQDSFNTSDNLVVFNETTKLKSSY